MNLQGTLPINTQFFTNLETAIGITRTEAELQAIIDEGFASISGIKQKIEYELELIAPIIALLSLNISDLPSVITFLENLVTELLTPQLKPYITYAQQLTALATAIAELPAAISSAISRIEDELLHSITITIPSI